MTFKCYSYGCRCFCCFLHERRMLCLNTCRDKLKTLPDLFICFLPRKNLIMFRYNPFSAFKIISVFFASSITVNFKSKSGIKNIWLYFLCRQWHRSHNNSNIAKNSSIPYSNIHRDQYSTNDISITSLKSGSGVGGMSRWSTGYLLGQ